MEPARCVVRVAIVAGKSVVPRAGGQGTFCAQLAIGLVQLGHHVTILNLDSPDWSSWVSGRPGQSQLVTAPISLSRFRAADIIHVNAPWLRALIFGALARKPVVITHHDYRAVCRIGMAWLPDALCSLKPGGRDPCPNCPFRGPVAGARRRLQQFLSRRAIGVAVSESLKTRLGLGDHILNPIDGDHLPDLSAKPTGPGIAYIGRLAAEKGVETAIDALELLPAEVTLDVFGDGPRRSLLERYARDRHLAGRVRFRGVVPEPVLAAGDHSVIVVPSLWGEPFGYVTAESMAAGKAVVAAATGASVELLGADRGWLVPPGDKNALAQTLRRVMARPAERIRRGRLARAFVLRELHPVSVARRYERVYARALAP